MVNEVAVFVVHTPFQLWFVEQIVRSSVEFHNSVNVLLIENVAALDQVDSSTWHHVEELFPVGESAIGRGQRTAVDVNLQRIRTLLSNYSHPASILLSDIAWPLNNQIFFDRRLRRMGVQYKLFMDGIGTYLGARISGMGFVRNCVKRGISYLGGGIAYRPYWGKLMGEDRHEIKAVYAFGAHLLPCEPSKRADIRLPQKETVSLNKQKCLLLGQDYSKLLSPAALQILQERTLAFVRDFECQDYYYKPYHQKDFSSSIDNSETDFYMSKGFIPVWEPRPIEAIIHTTGIGTVISYNSSALFNLKLIFGDKIRCISLFGGCLANLTPQRDILAFERMFDLFQRAGVEVINWHFEGRPHLN